MRKRVAVIFVSLAFVLLFFIFTSTKGSSQLHLNLADFYNKLSEDSNILQNQYVTLYGIVVEGSVQRAGTSATFKIMADDVGSLDVFFEGSREVLPDTFQEGIQVSLEGTYKKFENKFLATKVMAKCASKYENRI